jgi:HlyD family secretion protein
VTFSVVKPPLPALRPGEAGWLDLGARTRSAVRIASSAVVDAPSGTFVFIADPDGRHFARRSVRVGRADSSEVVVESGLEEGERVVGMGTFFIDAETRLPAETAVAPAEAR